MRFALVFPIRVRCASMRPAPRDAPSISSPTISRKRDSASIASFATIPPPSRRIPSRSRRLRTNSSGLTPTPRGLEIRDLARNAAMELYFEDDGDRGDEYNFDPVGDGAAIANPASISASVIDNGPVRKRTQALDDVRSAGGAHGGSDARARRSCEQLDVALTATLYAGPRPRRFHRRRDAIDRATIACAPHCARQSSPPTPCTTPASA